VFVVWQATLRPYLAPVFSKQLIMVGLRLSFTVVILCQGSKGLANPPTNDISTSRVSKFFTNKIRVLISSNFRQVTLFVADLTFSGFSQAELPVSANVPWAMLVILAMLAWTALERTTTTGWSWSSWWSLG